MLRGGFFPDSSAGAISASIVERIRRSYDDDIRDGSANKFSGEKEERSWS
jgi:hypothetical protein